MDHCDRIKRKTNPRETANIFSLLSFAYTGSLFNKAYKNDLEEEDLYEVIRCCASKECGDELEKTWLLEKKNKQSVSVTRLLWKRFGLKYFLFGMIELIWKVLISVAEPNAVSNMISYFTPGQTEITRSMAYYNASLVLLIYIVSAVYRHNYFLYIEQLAVEIKTSFSSLIYRKALRLSPLALSEISLGNIVTIITKDVQTFEKAIWIFNESVVTFVQTAVLSYLLYLRIGVVSLVGVGVLLSIMPIQLIIGGYISKLRLIAGQKTDERLQVTQETLSTIKIIKMYTWERFFENRITQARRIEMQKISHGFNLKIVLIILSTLFTKFAVYALIVSYLWSGYSLNAKTVFYIVSTFKELKYVLGILLPSCLGNATELYSSVIRINKILNGEELKTNMNTALPTEKPVIQLRDAVVRIKNIQVLNGVTLSVNSGLTVITGIVGSGKSVLLKTIVQDYPLSRGTLFSDGRISYASQDPWLFPSSIRQNIIFGEKYDEKRYLEVLRVCDLQYDFSLLAEGDETIVADKGLNLSKGQQARINLARAVYRESEIYLFDDSLTALDSHVQDYIFTECIKTFLKEKIVVLVSQTSGHIHEADFVVIMDKGKIKSYGTPNQNIIINELDNLVPRKEVSEKQFVDELKNVVEQENGEDVQLLDMEELPGKANVYSEVKKKGKVNFGIYLQYFMFGGGLFLLFINICLFGLKQAAESYSDFLLTRWVDEQQRVLTIKENLLTVESDFNISNGTWSSTQPIDFISSKERILTDAISEGQNTIKHYSLYMLLFVIASGIQTYLLFDYCRRASVNIHKSIVANIINATMSFFDTHFIGNILNRFSQDLNNIDELLPFTMRETIGAAFTLMGVVVLVATVNTQFLIYVGFLLIFTYKVRCYYIPTGRSLKRLEAATRSPMVGHLNASLEGLTTIRTHGVQEILIKEFDKHQDLYTSARFTSLCASRAFGFIVDCLCNILVTLVVIRFILVDTGDTAGNVGLAITQVLHLVGMVQFGVRQWSEQENLMTSAERLLEYTKIKPESNTGTEIQDWPYRGSLKFNNVSLTYKNSEVVLKNLNFVTKPQEKIGIVGRTGAGKSSIISTLFRLYEVDGDILIDDVRTKSLNLKFLRKKIAIIPQDPVLFSGTIRTNLDTFNEFTDDELWRVIDMVGLKPLVDSLYTLVTNSVSTFSSGQKQLVCLARATLMKTKILILDEATANMDHETDIMLNETINKIFSECTIFIIAHRLQSILNCDRVMVMERGELKEFDSPSVLIDNKTGLFRKMVEEAGLLSSTS